MGATKGSESQDSAAEQVSLLQGAGKVPGYPARPWDSSPSSQSAEDQYTYKGARYNEQPPQTNRGSEEGWHHGLFDCFSDIPLCLQTCFCPCITVGQNIEVIDNGVTPCPLGAAFWYLFQQVTGCACIYSCMYRSRLRAKYHLPEEPCWDCCVHGCCLPCALCQEYKELRTRGLDPALGWQHGRTVVVPPQPQRLQ
ncbi:hypothetical protein KFL_000050400 [Klebsormidium nitens]|uniref:PLAC8 family protein n=1 Tax=Klebsormidium nitens TaxID=105231 RepID=A0A1Y1HJ22_KLENI|nr:hypothetical protein KFL_000050400 [Klebsormidium nitens]|eukprot:GAQ77903.1 hypothetical protein KFL_000050400 [Klebsormidium nitens]